MHQACGAHPELPCLLTQPQGKLRVEGPPLLFDTTAVGVHVLYAKRQGWLIDVTEHFSEKRCVACVVIGQAYLRDVVAIRHRRLQVIAVAEQQRLHLAADDLHRSVIQHQVMKQQNRDGFAARRLLGMHQTHQGCLGQIQSMMTGVELVLQTVDDGIFGVFGLELDGLYRQLGSTPDHLLRTFQTLPHHRGAQDIVAVDDFLQGCGPAVQTLRRVERQTPLQQIGIALFCGQVVVENAFLQRCQRVDLLHIGSTARHAGDYTING